MTTRGFVLVVDDDAQVRDTVGAILQKHGFEVMTAASGPEALDQARTHDFDVILLDLRMPIMDGMDVMRHLKEREYPAEVIFLTGYGTVSSAVDALKLGAMDYLVKTDAVHELPWKTLQAVEHKRRKANGVLGQALQSLADAHRLTPKQVEVCKNVIAGLSNAEIAREMGISEHTVKTHLKLVFERLSVESRTELVAKILQGMNMSMNPSPNS